jgi:mitochondrial cardiolipin hydrolase
MKPQEFQRILDDTIKDGQLSRKEANLLREFFRDSAPSEGAVATMRSLVFRTAKASISNLDGERLLAWLERVLKTIDSPKHEQIPRVGVVFGPTSKLRDEIIKNIKHATWAIDVCVFNITENAIARALIHAHRDRQVAVRIITDDETTKEALGNDVKNLVRAGIPVAVDSNLQHMHNKFSIFDQDRLLTGSANWTKAGWSGNYENILFTDDPRLVEPHLLEFEKLWATFGRLE